MGALTSLTRWIPEDDLLLKNAVEAGASLESLAKGAVQFSRRYTIRELRDRWRSLLYDLDTSIEASARMAEIENDLKVSNLSKGTQACNSNSKAKELASTKRKADSVRSHYIAMRKKIRRKPCAVDVNYFEPSPFLVTSECNDDSRKQLMIDSKHPTGDFGLEVPFPDDYGHPETGYASAQHAFPELMSVDSAAANGSVPHHAYHAGHIGIVDDVTRDGPSADGCLIAYQENISSMLHDEAECNNGTEHNFQRRDFPHILGENLMDTTSEIHEIGPSTALGTSSLYKDEGIGAKPLSHLGLSNNDCEGFCADLVSNDNLSPHVTEYGGSFHKPSKYLSDPSSVPIWKTMEHSSTSKMPIEGHYRDKTQGLLHMDDHENINPSGCDSASSEPKLDDEMFGAGLNNQSMMPENDFMDFPDPLDFEDDESLFYMNEKGNTDGSCLGLCSILLDSPGDIHHMIANKNDVGPPNVSEACLEIPGTSCYGELNVICDQMLSQHPDEHNSSVLGVNVSSTSSHTSNMVELQEEFMICVINTEDLDVPNNDNAIFPDPAPFSSNLEQSTREATALVSDSNLSLPNVRNPVGGLCKVDEHVANMQPTSSSSVQPTGSSSKPSPLSLLKIGALQSSDGCTVGVQPPVGSYIAGCITYADSRIDDANPCRSETVGLNSTPVVAIKEQTTAPCFQNQDNTDNSFASFLESHLQETDDPKIPPSNAADNLPEEAVMPVGLQIRLPMQPDVDSSETGFSEEVAMVSTSDQEEQFYDSEDDIPYFSDIEALILEMDLGQYDEESCLLSKEASRYQHINPKDTIRLEQSFISRTNRSILSHGAFAVFYGRHLKYFIKDTEVSIGRETEDKKVDIDLGREGRANKISRRQAIIKMDENGLFSLKNIGKFSIFVNGQTVPAKKLTNLPPHSLIKIQDMHFAFEVNKRAVEQHIKKMRRGCQELSTSRFDWRP